MKRITSTDLSNWAPTRDCQEHLPLLVRKLIRASNIEVLKLLIPTGDDVILPGFDGTVEVVAGTEQIPIGKSVWEMGTNQEPRQKANEDFNRRTNELDESEIIETSFVFVTPRRFSNSKDWIDKKKKESKWKEIKVIDGQVLEDWLEQQPSVGFWLSKFLQIPLGNVLSLDNYWEEWSAGTSYSIPSSLLIFGRENEVTQLTNFLSDPPNKLIIKASTIDEATAFVASCVEKMDSESKEKIYSKAIIIKSEEDFRLVVHSKRSMIFIAGFNIGSIANQAVRKNHHLIIPIGNDVTDNNVNIQLPRIKRKGFEDGLKEMGFSYEVSEAYIRDSGQSLLVLRKLLGFETPQQPLWASNGNQADIIPALLIGRWSEEKEEDKAIVSLIADDKYENYKSKLLRWKLDKDAPIFQIKSIWRLTSVLDAWSILSAFVTKSDLDNLQFIFLFALQEINPALELELDKRYLAPLYKKVPQFSYSIKEGLCHSMTMIAVFGERFNLNSTASPQGYVDEVISKLLYQASGDLWCTLSKFLPLIAEASPRAFLQAVELSLNQDNPTIMEMFGEAGDFFMSGSYYTYLLWALENLLFSPDYFVKAILILGRLSKLDPGGKLSNRPLNTLIAVFIPWFRQTEVDFEGKRIALQKLIESEPSVAWSLLLKLMPNSQNHISPIHTCKWRFNTQYLEREVSNYDVYHFYSFVFRSLLVLATEDEQKVSQLIDFYPYINIDDRTAFQEYLKNIKNETGHSESLIWNELRELIGKHKRNAQENWAIPEVELLNLEEILKLHEPNALSKKYQYLFETGWIDFVGRKSRKEMTMEERNNYFNKLREDAFKKIYNQAGTQEIFNLAGSLKYVQYIAHAASKVIVNTQDERRILGLLAKEEDDNLYKFAKQFIYYKYWNFKDTWIKETWNSLKNHNNSDKFLTDFFLSLPPARDVWDLLESTSETIIKGYWQNVSMPQWTNEQDENIYIIQNLQLVNRHISVMQVLSYVFEKVSTELLCEGLQNAVTIKSDEEAKLDPPYLGMVFNELYKRNDLDEQKIIQLELYYLSVLADRYNESRPKYLHRELTSNPDFFVEVVSYVHLPDKEIISEKLSGKELESWLQRRSVFRDLLESWRKIPGVQEDNTIDKKALNEWISKARDKAKEYNILSGVDGEIGSLLATFPRNDKYWPPEEICEVLDTLKSKTMLSHFSTEIFNSRGTYLKSAYEGGEQERNLATYFETMGKRISLKYPLTAEVLSLLAETYKRDCKDEDDDAYFDELR